MIVTRGLEAFYRFEGNANDSSGNGRNGTVSGATLTTSGKFGSAYSFDGVDGIITYGSMLNVNTNPFTVAGWVQRGPVGTQKIILTNRQDGGVNRIVVTSNSGSLAFYSQEGIGTGKFTNLFSSGELTTDWTHFAVTRSGANVKGYINGVEAVSVTNQNSGDIGSANNWSIGGRGDSGANTFNGLIDEPMVFSRALSAGNIRRCMLGMHPF